MPIKRSKAVRKNLSALIGYNQSTPIFAVSNIDDNGYAEKVLAVNLTSNGANTPTHQSTPSFSSSSNRSWSQSQSDNHTSDSS